jgi:hypothetical protein
MSDLLAIQRIAGWEKLKAKVLITSVVAAHQAESARFHQ